MIELACLRWLRFENRCMIVINERTPLYGHGQPDVLGVTKARFLKEIEVKRTISDFRANSKKYHVVNREHLLHNWPRQFYYAVPLALKDKVKSELPEWAGLLTVDCLTVNLEVNAPINKQARRLSVKHCIRLVECMANQIACQSSDIINLQSLQKPDCACHLDDLFQNGWWLKDGSRMSGYTNFQI